MAVLPFAEYRPDLSDLNREYTSSVLNVLPRLDGYGPFKDSNDFTTALAAPCRGLFYARNNDGSIRIFAGTSTKLYMLDNTNLTWTDVSRGGSTYTTVATNANWTFAQFNDYVIATQANDDVQVYQIGVSSAFANLGGSPPRSAYCAVVNRFLVLTGLGSFPRRVQWSGLNAITTWTSGTNFSDYQDLPDGGNTTRVVGGEFGVIFQDSGIRRMVYVPDSDIVFQIDRLAKDLGDAAPYGVIDADGKVFFYSQKGFYSLGSDGSLTPIGRERVDRTFADEYDTAYPQLLQGAANPSAHLALWAYKRTEDNVTYWTRILAYDYVLDKWTKIEMNGEYLVALAKPGITLESLDLIGSTTITGAANNGSGAIRITVGSTSGWTTGDQKTIASVGGTTEANGTWTITVVSGTTFDLDGSTFTNAYTSGGYVAGTLEDLSIISLDDVSAATLAQFSMVDTENKVCYFTGDNLEATLETSEQSGIAKRLFVRGFYPVTDASGVVGCVGRRENLYTASSYTTEAAVTAQGYIPQRASTRHARAKIRIPHAETWTFATGVEPDVTSEGRR
jgi:hypothetical protein